MDENEFEGQGQARQSAVHADDPGVQGTHELLGEEECRLGWTKYARIDERNLWNCRRLGISNSKVQSLDCSRMKQLEELNTNGSKLPTINTFGLRALAKLHLWGCPMKQLDTLDLVDLIYLNANQPRIA